LMFGYWWLVYWRLVTGVWCLVFGH